MLLKVFECILIATVTITAAAPSPNNIPIGGCQTTKTIYVTRNPPGQVSPAPEAISKAWNAEFVIPNTTVGQFGANMQPTTTEYMPILTVDTTTPDLATPIGVAEFENPDRPSKFIQALPDNEAPATVTVYKCPTAMTKGPIKPMAAYPQAMSIVEQYPYLGTIDVLDRQEMVTVTQTVMPTAIVNCTTITRMVTTVVPKTITYDRATQLVMMQTDKRELESIMSDPTARAIRTVQALQPNGQLQYVTVFVQNDSIIVMDDADSKPNRNSMGPVNGNMTINELSLNNTADFRSDQLWGI